MYPLYNPYGTPLWGNYRIRDPVGLTRSNFFQNGRLGTGFLSTTMCPSKSRPRSPKVRTPKRGPAIVEACVSTGAASYQQDPKKEGSNLRNGSSILLVLSREYGNRSPPYKIPLEYGDCIPLFPTKPQEAVRSGFQAYVAPASLGSRLSLIAFVTNTAGRPCRVAVGEI